MATKIRWKQRFLNYEKACAELLEASRRKDLDKLGQAGLIQMFEVAFELAWKTLKDKLEYEGYEVNSPRAAIKTAFQAGVISDGELWMTALEKRNLLSHSYDEVLSREACNLIQSQYAKMFLFLKRRTKRRINYFFE